MNILVFAPHPFYQERGSPMRLAQVIKVLTERGDQIDVLTYHEGKAFHSKNVNLYRSCNIPFIHDVQPGFSLKKVICDFFMLAKAISLVLKNRYHVLYALEESVFMALIINSLFRIPYVYAMDSSLPQQLTERYSFLEPYLGVLNIFEKLAVRKAIAVIPVCNALADAIAQYRPRKVVILHDVSYLNGLDHFPRDTTALPQDHPSIQ